MVEQGREYNPETAQDLRPQRFHFRAHGFDFRYELQVPEYILARLDSGLMDSLQQYMEGYCADAILAAIRGGYLLTEAGNQRIRTDVALHLRNYLWERFSITQEHAGNACWQVAPTLQKVHA